MLSLAREGKAARQQTASTKFGKGNTPKVRMASGRGELQTQRLHCPISNDVISAPAHLLSLITAVAVMAAVLLTLFGTTQRVYPGFWWWVAAQWLLSLGLFLQLLEPRWPLVAPLAHALELQWPIVVLSGFRRFYARREWRVPALADAGLLGACFGAWLLVRATSAHPDSDVVAFCAASAVLHSYAAVNALMLAEVRQSSALKVFIFLAASVTLAQGLRTGTSALTLVYLGLLLTFERTERNVRISQRRLKFLADTDILTGVPNRRHFHERAERALNETAVTRNALLMFDIDHFKQVNDRLGHAAGDEALRQVALCTRQALRSVDVAGRLGGDEFGVLLPATTIEEAMAVASRIVERLERRQVAPHLVRLSLSFGVVQMAPNESITDGLRRADQALYEAKRLGRGRAVAASGEVQSPVFRDGLTFG
jgi:diguanylate cyclase